MWSKHDASTLQDHCNAVFSTALGHLEDLLVHTLCLFSINHIRSTQNLGSAHIPYHSYRPSIFACKFFEKNEIIIINHIYFFDIETFFNHSKTCEKIQSFDSSLRKYIWNR